MKFLSDILAKAGLTVDGVVTLNNTATGQTPNANDNSTKLATTAWVRTFVQPYSLPIASDSILGGIKVGSGLSIDASTGVLTATGGITATNVRNIQKFTATAGQTIFTITNGYVPGLVDVFVNGVKLDNSSDFTATNGSTITLTNAVLVNDIVEAYCYVNTFAANNALRTSTTFVATAGQTTFTVDYNPGFIDVFYNGSKLVPTEYTASNGTSVVFGTACILNDLVEIISYTYSVNGFTGVSSTRTLTINGTTYDLSANRTWSITNTSLGAQPQLNGTGLVRMSGTTVSYDNASYATESYVTTAVANLVNAAPSTLDTLNELATALGNDANFSTTVASSIATKQPQLNGTGFVKVSGTTVSYDNSTYYLASNPSSYITLSSLSAIAPLTYNNTTGVLNINQASSTVSGWLSYTDWVTFNSKQAAGNYVTTDTTQNISGAKTFTTQLWIGANAVIGGSNGQIQFDAAASSDLFISCIPGTRTVQIRNGNSGSPNYAACGLITGYATFLSTISAVSGVNVQAANNSDLPYINFSNNGGVYNWGRIGGLLQGDGDGSLYFQTKQGSSLGTKLTITSTGAASFVNSITAGGDITIAKTTPGLILNGLGSGNSGAYINFQGWASSNKNWQIGVANIGPAGLLFTPSTATGGTSFSSSVFTLTDAGGGIFSGGVTTSAYSYLYGLRISGNDTGNTIYAGSANMGITAEAGYNISIGRVSDTTKALNINTTNGYLGVGISPSYPLHVSSNIQDYTAFIVNTNASNNAGLLIKAGVNNGNEILTCQKGNGSEIFKVDVSGEITSTNGEMYFKRSAFANYGHVYMGSDRHFYVRNSGAYNMYLQTNGVNHITLQNDGVTKISNLRTSTLYTEFQLNLSGGYNSGTYYKICDSSELTAAGIYMLVAYVDTYAIGGGTYFCSYVSVPFYWFAGGSNSTSTQTFPTMLGTGHHNLNPPIIRIRLDYAVNGAKQYLEFDPNSNWSNVQGTGGATVTFYVKRLGI